MPYKPENDISENVIKRNSLYKKVEISCCTCSICMKSDSTASLKLFNFKSASPIVNPDSIGSTITYFYDYMIPSGEFEYLIDPVVSSSLQYNVNSNPDNIADYLIYYPFRNCSGINGGGQNYPQDDPCPDITQVVDPYGETLRYSFTMYDSRFNQSGFYGDRIFWIGLNARCDFPEYLGYSPYYLFGGKAIGNDFNNFYEIADPNLLGWSYYRFRDFYFPMQMSNPGGQVGYLYDNELNAFYGKIKYDYFYGSYLTRTFTNIPYQNTSFFNYPVEGFYCSPYTCEDVFMNSYAPFWSPVQQLSVNGNLASLPDGSIITSCENVDIASTYPWKTRGLTGYVGIPYSVYYGSHNVSYNGEIYNSYNQEMFKSYFFYYYGSYNVDLNEWNVVQSMSKVYYGITAPSNFPFPKCISEYYNFNPLVVEPSPEYYKFLSQNFSKNLKWFPLSKKFKPGAWFQPYSGYGYPCSTESLIEMFGENSLSPTVSPMDVNIGNYQSLIDYISSHDYSSYGFKIGAGCENGIKKIMDAKYIVDVDGFNFPYLHQNYNTVSTNYYVTNKFLTPTINGDFHDECVRKYKKTIQPPNPPLQPNEYWYLTLDSYPNFISLGNTVFNGDPQMNIINEPEFSLLAKGGYILKNFKYFKNGNFEINIGAVDESGFLVSMTDGHDLQQKSYINGQRYPVPNDPRVCDYIINFWEYYSDILYPNYGNHYDGTFLNEKQMNENAEVAKEIFSKSRKEVDLTVYSTSHYHQSSVSPIFYFSYNSQNQIQQIWLNGLFRNAESSAKPVFCEHYNSCGNQFYWEKSLTVSDYIGTVGENTYQTHQTDASGVTTTTIYNVLFIGKKLLEKSFVHSSGNNRPVLAGGNKVPLNYKAYLNGGFECDIQIQYRSIPFCKVQSIVDRFKRVESLKVKFENYSKIPGYQTTNTDLLNLYMQENPYDFLTKYYESTNIFNEYVFCPPTMNANSEFYMKRNKYTGGINKKWGIYEKYGNVIPDVEKTFATSVSAYNTKIAYTVMNGRMYGNDYPDDFKSSFYVKGTPQIWETGNKIKISAPSPLNNVFLPNINYYCIFVKDLKENENAEDYCQIRIATTYQNAIDGNYIEIKNNIGKPIYAKNFNSYINFVVTYKDDLKNISRNVLPGYLNFKPSDYTIGNANLQKLGIPFTTNGFRSTNGYGQLSLSNRNLISFGTGGNYFDPDSNAFGFQFVNTQNYSVLSGNSFDHMEVISLSPIKIILKRFLFKIETTQNEFFYNYQIYGQNKQSLGYFGFLCDIIIEEDLDEYTVPSLPSDFNRITSMIDEINTQNPYQKSEPVKKQLFVIPEKCKHIGKVIDRKDCNCPKKWVRQCDIFQTTDWKQCMGCDRFEYED